MGQTLIISDETKLAQLALDLKLGSNDDGYTVKILEDSTNGNNVRTEPGMAVPGRQAMRSTHRSGSRTLDWISGLAPTAFKSRTPRFYLMRLRTNRTRFRHCLIRRAQPPTMRTLKSPAPTKEFLKRSTISSPRFCPATLEVAIRGPTTLTSKVFAVKTSVSTNALKTSRPTLSNGRKLSVRDSCGWRKCNPSSTRNFKPYKIHSRNHERPFPPFFVLAGPCFLLVQEIRTRKGCCPRRTFCANQPLSGRATSFLFQSRGCTALLSCGSGYAAIGLRR